MVGAVWEIHRGEWFLRIDGATEIKDPLIPYRTGDANINMYKSNRPNEQEQ